MLHSIKWTSNDVERFWNYDSEMQETGIQTIGYFSAISGPYLLKLLHSKLNFTNKAILDYGCGSGFLIKELCEKYKPKYVYGCDVSSKSVEYTNLKCSCYPPFQGCEIISDDIFLGENDRHKSLFDIVFVLEVIEHLNDDEICIIINRVRPLLKNNGVVIFSTPNQEDLSAAYAVCPECGCYFHRFQHVRSWNKESIISFMENQQIKTKLVLETTLFAPEFLKPIFAKAYSTCARILGKKQKNLIYIGTPLR